MKRLAIATLAALVIAFAQAAQAQGGGSASVCFEVIAARPNVEPPAPIMIDKCSGRSWVLIRNGKSYRWSLIATEIPYGVAKAKLIEQIATLIADKKLPILSDVRDESDASVRVVLGASHG